MSVLNKEQLLEELKLKTEIVPLASGDVIVSQVGAVEYMEAFNDKSIRGEKDELDGTKLTALLAVRSVVDETGKRIFEDTDTQLFLNGASAVFSAIGAAVKRLNGITGGEVKNSEPSPSDSSASASA